MGRGGMHGRGTCVVVGGGGHAWLGACVAGGVCGRGCTCHTHPQTPRDMVGQCAGGTHPTGMHSC